ncbi:E3 ubiquitin/ISG15 ligase TRIM25-like [Eleutherodactylus coqui]|uniref:E3 ubiquitin/ISG15 ligase TRIM25-like n=1 Tax=Eleutherodactylus coqui TaxID=57060 RepID=UPI003462783E
MASAAVRDELLCSICLSTYTDPVMLRCGHTFCRVCIHRALDTQDEAGVYSCPECREESQERPELIRCLALCNIMENFLITPPTQTEAEIFCTYCVDSPVPAAKFCLMCEASLCKKHLRVHSKSAEHVLCEPRASLGSRKCSVHKKILEYYCTEDAACICVTCSLAREHLEIQKDELSRKMRHMEELCNMTDPLTVLQEPDTGDLYDPEDTVGHDGGDGDTGGHDGGDGDMRGHDGGDGDTRGHGEPLHDVDGRDVAVISDTLHTLCDIVTDIRRGIYVEGPADILLDVNTAGDNIHISDDLKTATCTVQNQNHPETEERFQYHQFVPRRNKTH